MFFTLCCLCLLVHKINEHALLFNINKQQQKGYVRKDDILCNAEGDGHHNTKYAQLTAMSFILNHAEENPSASNSVYTWKKGYILKFVSQMSECNNITVQFKNNKLNYSLFSPI